MTGHLPTCFEIEREDYGKCASCNLKGFRVDANSDKVFHTATITLNGTFTRTIDVDGQPCDQTRTFEAETTITITPSCVPCAYVLNSTDADYIDTITGVGAGTGCEDGVVANVPLFFQTGGGYFPPQPACPDDDSLVTTGAANFNVEGVYSENVINDEHLQVTITLVGWSGSAVLDVVLSAEYELQDVVDCVAIAVSDAAVGDVPATPYDVFYASDSIWQVYRARRVFRFKVTGGCKTIRVPYDIVTYAATFDQECLDGEIPCGSVPGLEESGRETLSVDVEPDEWHEIEVSHTLTVGDAVAYEVQLGEPTNCFEP